jgi:hypothetical protein
LKPLSTLRIIFAHSVCHPITSRLPPRLLAGKARLLAEIIVTEINIVLDAPQSLDFPYALDCFYSYACPSRFSVTCSYLYFRFSVTWFQKKFMKLKQNRKVVSLCLSVLVVYIRSDVLLNGFRPNFVVDDYTTLVLYGCFIARSSSP